MHLTPREQRALYIQTKVAVHAELVRAKVYREKPEAAAQDARLHARASVHDERINGMRK